MWKRLKCYFLGHDWELVLDVHNEPFDLSVWYGYYGKGHPCVVSGLPTRRCVFNCRRCGEKAEFKRFAFNEGGGALYYFFGRYWPFLDNYKVNL